MPRKPSGDFDQKAYIAEYHRTHLRALTIKVQRDEYDRFQAACEAKGEPMATVLRRFMAQYAETKGSKAEKKISAFFKLFFKNLLTFGCKCDIIYTVKREHQPKPKRRPKMIKLKKTTIKDIVEYGTNCKVIDLSIKYSEELGNTVIYIRATIQVSEVIGKTTITEKQTANLIYIADTHALLNSEWEQIA